MNEETSVATGPVLDPIKKSFIDAWGIYKKSWLVIVGAVATAVAVCFAAYKILEVSGSPLALIVVVPIVIVCGLWMQVVPAYAALHAGEAFDAKIFVRATVRLMLPYFWIALLSWLIVLSGITLLILPGIFLAVMLFFAGFVLVDENVRGRDALVKSYEYVRGSWWAVFVRVLLVYIAIFVVSTIITYIPKIGQTSVANLISSALTAPFWFAYLVVLYKNLRALKTGEVAPEVAKKEKLVFTILAVLGVAATGLLVYGFLFFLAVAYSGAY